MKKIEYAPAVEITMRYVDPDDERRLLAWFDRLARWDEDEAVRKSSYSLPGHDGVFVLKTTTDIRIFFRIDGDTLTILDVARLSAILAFGGNGGTVSPEATVTPGSTKVK